MSIRVQWLDDHKTVILREIVECWTWDEFYKSLYGVSTMLRSIGHTVHLVEDFSQASDFPGNEFMSDRTIVKIKPANFGKAIAVVPSPLYREMYQALSLVFPMLSERVVFANTRDEAFAGFLRAEARA